MSSDSSKKELEEFVGRFIQRNYRSDDGSLCVCQYENVRKPDEIMTLVGANLPEVTFPVTFRGRRVYSARFRQEQLQVEMILNHLPDSKEETVAFLVSLRIGIGKFRAMEMIDLVGINHFWAELERDPLQFVSVNGITHKILNELQAKTNELIAQDALCRFFSGDLPMDGKQYSAIRKHFDNDLELMVSTVRENPFCLMECGYGFPELDFFSSRHTLFPMNDYRRLLAATQQALIDARQQSHVGLPHDVIVGKIQALLNQNGWVCTEDIEGFLYSAAQAQAVVYDLDLYYLPRAYKEELLISDILTKLASKEPHNFSRKKFDKLMEKYGQKKGFMLSPDQQESVWTALTRSVCVITGGPGTGKSTILDAILFCWKKFHGDDWLLMAPTGKAAVRMTETTSQPAWTIHSSLSLSVGSESLTEVDETEVEITQSLIVIDESSMLDQTVMSALTSSLKGYQNQVQHLIIVGDPNQLPSVGWGNVLADIIESGVIPVRRLATIYRQGAGNPIITNSAKMQAGDVDLDWSNPIFKRYHHGTDIANMEAACKLYCRYVKQVGIENVVLLSPYHKATDISTNSLNKQLQDAVNPLQPGAATIRASKTLSFREGDRVMQLVNTEQVSNGEVGTIQWISPSATGSTPAIGVNFESGVYVEYLRDSLHQLDLAYSMSIHKSQGSQWKVVIIVLPCKPTAFLRRNLLYTGITRSSRVIALVSPTPTISYCITNDKQDMRYTNLAHRLRNSLNPASAAA